MKIITLPFAGGNKYSYSFLKRELPAVEIINLEYAGRGARMNEYLMKDINEVVNDIYLQIKITEGPYIIYGHSMGALIGYLVSIKLQESGSTDLKCLIVSGRYAPTVSDNNKTHSLSSELFWNKVAELNGTPAELIKDQELKLFFEPILRSDFKLIETYLPGDMPLLKIPVEVLYGRDEAANNLNDFYKWKDVSDKAVNFYEFDGGHFFILDKQKEVAGLILTVLIK